MVYGTTLLDFTGPQLRWRPTAMDKDDWRSSGFKLRPTGWMDCWDLRPKYLDIRVMRKLSNNAYTVQHEEITVEPPQDYKQQVDCTISLVYQIKDCI